MLAVKNTFEERANEVEIYYNFLKDFVENGNNDDLNKILKSNLLLMLYNLVESSVSNAIEEIHNDIHRNSISFNVLKNSIQKALIKFLKSEKGPSPDNFVIAMNDVAIDIVKKCFNKQKISNGNIDNSTIKDFGDKYGFNSNTTYALTKNGICLRVIRGRRNDLAHGTFSFTEVGKDFTPEDLEKMKNETINYLKEIIDNINDYLINQKYLQQAI